ncbi:MAG: STAS domain-containing protein [Leptospirales bacterium]|jgi:anti-anti-sigma factor
MKIESRTEDGVVVLHAGGRMTLDQITDLDFAVRRHLEGGARKFVLNLADVTDISSTGVGRLYQLHTNLELSQGRMILADISQVCEYVLDLARMNDVFTIMTSEAAAIKELAD